MRRVFILVLDSLGVGALPDADRFGDAGTHTLDHIVSAAGGLDVPRLTAIGLGHVPGVTGVPRVARPEGAFGRMAERSIGKDTSTGHWEMMGCPLEHAFPVFPEGFPDEIIDAFVERSGVPGILCNAAASGTEVIERLGVEHIATGKPIVYTSADSVFQVAAHEAHFGLERLYEVCLIAREILTPHGVARVIARPFVGAPGAFERTYNRKDYSLEPPHDTALDRLKAGGVPVVAVGKIEDIFAGRGVTRSVHTEGNRDGMRKTTRIARELEGGLCFLNLVDFDMLYGHRRDAPGYRRALEEFDADYVAFEAELRADDIVLLTADHGNDPTHAAGTDHTREYVPILAAGPGVKGGVDLGTRTSFADVGATVEEAFGLVPGEFGRSFLAEIRP
ncbi:MAG: phosphopentomutase [Planctomycetota bacterium]|nr:MAG: phosphopentomutase [Planctomycetota bacterium]